MMNGIGFSKEKTRIVLLENIHASAVETLGHEGYDQVENYPKAMNKESLIEVLQGAHLVGIRSTTRLTREVFHGLRENREGFKLRAIGCFCIGTNQVDLDVAAEFGVPVFNAPHSNTRSVAELVIGEAIMLMRNIFPKSVKAHQKGWDKSAEGSHEVRGKTIGIVGYGHIGSQVSVLAESMGFNVLFYDVLTKLPLGNAKKCDTLESLLQLADIVTLHVPATKQTVNMMGAAELALMKQGKSYLINASRGNVVDIDALADLLTKKHILGAAIDVFPQEPESNKEPFESPLIGMSNVILTPHIGGSTQEAQFNIGIEVASKLASYMNQGQTLGAVNFPNVNLPRNSGAHRIIHIHENVPGILQKVNGVFANEQVNVLGEHLDTRGKVGCVLTDISKDVDRDFLIALGHRLSDIPGTILSRIIY